MFTLDMMDPTYHYREERVPMRRIVDAMGILPLLAESVSKEAPETVQEAVELMAIQYGFGALFDFGDKATVTPEGVYKYPEDPDLYPFVLYPLSDTVELLIYPHAICVLRSDTETFVTRMD